MSGLVVRCSLAVAASVTLCAAGARAGGRDGHTRVAAGASALPLLDAWVDAGSSGPAEKPLVQAQELAGAVRLLVQGETSALVVIGPLTESAAQALPLALHLPLAVSGVALAANLPGEGPVRLSFEVLAAIELGAVKTWDDPAIAELNPGRELPAWPITPLQRSDPADVTAVLSAAISARVPAFRERLGAGALVAWPAGRRLRGARDLALELSMVRGALGYLDAVAGARATAQGLAPVALPDSAGSFVLPEPERLRAAAAGAVTGDSGRAQLPEPPPAGAWPVSALVFLVADPTRDPGAIALARWALEEGTPLAVRAGFAALPERVRRDALSVLHRREKIGLLSGPSSVALAR